MCAKLKIGMRKFLIQAIFLLVGAFFALYIFQGGTEFSLPFVPAKTIVKTVVINDARISAEIANTQDKRRQGLGGRTTLGDNEGMLFVFEAKGKYPFWMKGINFPLDFIWIADDMVSGVLEDVAPPASGQKEELLPIYQSKEDIDKVLEVKAGTVKKYNIKAGDKLTIE